jgi:hypothetical protein
MRGAVDSAFRRSLSSGRPMAGPGMTIMQGSPAPPHRAGDGFRKPILRWRNTGWMGSAMLGAWVAPAGTSQSSFTATSRERRTSEGACRIAYMHLIPAGPLAELDRYIGYWKPYASSHQELDADTAVQEEVRNAAHARRSRHGASQGRTLHRGGRFATRRDRSD